MNRLHQLAEKKVESSTFTLAISMLETGKNLQNHILKRNFFVSLDFELEVSQNVRFLIKFATTCQILTWNFFEFSDFGKKSMHLKGHVLKTFAQ